MEPLLSHRALLLVTITILVLFLEQPPFFMGMAAQTNKMTQGSIMTPTDQNLIKSSSGLFAFGFCNFDPSVPAQLLLAIWFDFGSSNCIGKAVVWFAISDPTTQHQAVNATAESVLALDDNTGLLTLTDGSATLWSPNQQPASTLILQDSGNLQLLDSRGVAQWQSFDYPAHALLPGQILTYREGIYLMSKDTDTDFSPGRFLLAVQVDHNIVLYMRDPDGDNGMNPYWASGDTIQQGTAPNVTLDGNSGNLYYYPNGTGGNTSLTPRKDALRNYHYYAALDPDGTVRVYFHPKNNVAAPWAVFSSFPEGNGCSRQTDFGLQGICGPNSYCLVSSKDDDQRLKCSCATKTHEFIDEKHPYRGCRPSFLPQSCDGQDHSGEFETVESPEEVAWSNRSAYKKYLLSPETGTTAQRCNEACLSDCFCMGVLINDSTCMFVGMLTGGNFDTNGVDNKMKAHIKIRSRSTSPVPHHFQIKLSGKWIFITPGILVVALVVLPLITNVLGQNYARHKEAKRSMAGLRSFTYKELSRATNGFKEKDVLGKGGFGEVFKGELSSLRPPHVAVKRLFKSKEHSGKDFENEVQSIGQIHHKNLVRMIGYCKQGAHRMLVFEYMQGGTLANFILGSVRPCWSCLVEAAIGIAKGLEYLHEGCKSKIIHCDIKPDNILFDDRHIPRITDFGIAKLLGDEKTQKTVVNTIVGTKPYIAPEWLDGSGKVNSKVDVYSFGVVLLEIICCKSATGGQPLDAQASSTMFPLRAWVESLVRGGNAELLVGGEIEALEDMESVERFARIAIWCLQKDPSARPTMRKVVQMLEGDLKVDPLPDPPMPPSFSASLPNALQVE